MTFKDFLGVIEKNINFIILSCLSVVLGLIHILIPQIKIESIGIIFSPFFTLLIFRIIEDHKIKWNSKYEAFKILYANRGQLLDPVPGWIVDEATVNVLNSIDILFIEDTNVRKCWKDLFTSLHKDPINGEEIKTLVIDLLDAMAISLKIKNNITYTDISKTYFPIHLCSSKTVMDERESKKAEYYSNGSLFFKGQVQSLNETRDLK